MTEIGKIRIVALVLVIIGISLAGCRKEPETVVDPLEGGGGTSVDNTMVEDNDISKPITPVDNVIDNTDNTSTTGNTVAVEPAAIIVHVLLETDKGQILLELDAKAAPVTVENFVQYVKDGFYDGTIFHRAIEGFMIQGGGFLPDMSQKPTRSPILNEASNGLKNKRGTVAMARTSLPHSATSQFFINHGDNDFLDYGSPRSPDGYAVFGKVIKGMDVVDAIAGAPTTTNSAGEKSMPLKPVVITKASVISGA